ncbi:MAG: guanine nucleotide exchange protein for ADP-robosylation factor [Peltula sp. TS41687]|nr:MAG: guanine nucleotide exchange protein for ADP-robosylation factor [Peltula sp. TS41687]
MSEADGSLREAEPPQEDVRTEEKVPEEVSVEGKSAPLTNHVPVKVVVDDVDPESVNHLSEVEVKETSPRSLEQRDGLKTQEAPRNGHGSSTAGSTFSEVPSTSTVSTPERKASPLSVSQVGTMNNESLDADSQSSPRLLPRQISASTHTSAMSARPRTESQSTAATHRTQASYPISSMIFVVHALEAIASSKEVRKQRQLGDAAQKALNAIKETDPQLPDPEVVFEPLQLATISGSIPLTTSALDTIGKLISYSYFAHPIPASTPPSGEAEAPVPLIERAIDTIIDCFQGEATPAEVQLQIVRSLLVAVLNDKIVIHGAGLLKAVRQTYNIFLLSKSTANQQIAQHSLTQMIGTVFERLKTRLVAKQTRLGLAKLTLQRGSEDQSRITLDMQNTLEDKSESKEEDVASETTSTSRAESPSGKGTEERITLQSFENRKSFDDNKINDNAPTMVTPAVNVRRGRGHVPRHAASANGDSVERRESPESAEENDEDEIYIKDAFLVFRAMCKLSIKALPPEQLLDIKSHGMRSKLLSLHIVHTILKNHMIVFTSPLATIRSSSNDDDPSTFLHATKQYLCLSLSRNGASSVSRVFEVSCEIFWLMLKNMRVMLKKEIEVFLKEIYLAILERRNSPATQKQYLMSVLERLCADPRALVEIYLNYDCDRSALDNMFQRVIEHLSRISSTAANITPLQQQQYREHHQRPTNPASDWKEPGTLPPSLSTADLMSSPEAEPVSVVEYSLKRQSLECLVATLRSLVSWSRQGNADESAERHDQSSRASIDESGESVVTPSLATSTSTPRIPSSETPGGAMNPPDDDPTRLELEKQQKTTRLNGIKLFNFKAKRGIQYLIKEGCIPSNNPKDIASFLLHSHELNKAMIGDYLGEGDAENVAIMHAFVDLMDFTKTRFVDALRRFLQSFRLPGEAQKIDRFMLKFAERYMAGNPNAFANADTAYVLAYSVIMLNTDQHSSKVKGQRMSREDFIKNNRGINDNADLPDDYLTGIYDEISHNEIVLLTERDTAAALGAMPQPAPGFAANISQALATVGRDLQREAYVQASEEMATKTEQLFRSLLRAQKRTASKSTQARFFPATSFKHVGPMFEVTWMSFLSGFSGQLQDTQDEETFKLCMEGFRLAIRISCLDTFDLETPRLAFVSALSRFTNLNRLNEMTNKNMEAVKTLLEIAQETAQTKDSSLKSSWKEVLTCISQLDRFQLISSGVDEGAIPDVSKARIVRPSVADSSTPRKSSQGPRRPRPRPNPSSTNYLPTVVHESRSTDVIKAVDRIFTNTANLSREEIVHFVRALSEVSWQEIQSSGQSDSPRTFSLQKVVEISYYNMTRVRIEWKDVWQVLGEHFNQVGCHRNTNVVFMALDSLRQLSMRFLDFEELSGFAFQKDFLKPFEHVMANSGIVPVKDMILRCLIQMIQARGDNIRSGWKTMFGVFTVAAREPYEAIVNLAFDIVTQIYNNRFGMVVSQGAFVDLLLCLTEFSKNMKFQKKSLQAIETLKAKIPRMLKTPEFRYPKTSKASANLISAGQMVPRSSEELMQEEREGQFWYPMLFAFHTILMTGDDLEVRSRALGYLFETIIKHGGSFSSDFWDTLWLQVLSPTFEVLKSTKADLNRDLNQEELSVWLSTTMIQALRHMITLFTHYFDSLERKLDLFLDLLVLCILQENDTIARIGSNCLQQLILQNVNKFENKHWTKIVSRAFVELFQRTTAIELFSSGRPSGSISPGMNGDFTPQTAQQEVPPSPGVPPGSPPLEESTSADSENVNSLKIKGLPPSKLPSQLQPASPTILPNGSSSKTATPTAPEDYRSPSETQQQQQPMVVTAERRREFNQIITKCVLQLLMIETVSELFSNDSVYARIPSGELLRLMTLLKKSFEFAREFNANKDLRMRLWNEGFMKQPPNLLKQESGSAATYVSILLRMYHDEGEERKRSRAEIEDALIPLCGDIINDYNKLESDTQQRNIVAWRPVVVDVLEGYTNFPLEGFDKYIDTFYPLAVELLGRDSGVEVRLALQALLRRIGERRMGMSPPPLATTINNNSALLPMSPGGTTYASSSVSGPTSPITSPTGLSFHGGGAGGHGHGHGHGHGGLGRGVESRR